MIKKKFMIFIIAILLLSSSNVRAAEDNNADTLDIEKAAIASISNAQSVKDFELRMKNADRHYSEAQTYTRTTLAMGRGNLIQAVILNPILAKNALDQFTTQKEVNTKAIILDAYSKYIVLLKANYAVNIQKELRDTLEKDNKKAKLQLSNGLISKNAAKLIEINYLKAKYQLSKLENNLDSAYMNINLTTGEVISKRYATLIDDNIVANKSPMTSADYVKNALSNRGETVNAQNDLYAKEKVLANTPSSWVRDYDTYARQSKYDIDNSKYNLDQAKINIQLEIEKGYKTLEGYLKALESQQASYDLAESNYEAARIQIDNSMITLNQFEGVEVAKAQAKMNLKNAELDAWLEASKMSFASGIGPGLN